MPLFTANYEKKNGAGRVSCHPECSFAKESVMVELDRESLRMRS